MPINRKVTAGAVGGGAIGLPLSVILVWLLGLAGVDVPANVSAAMGSLLSTLAGFAAGWWADA